MDHGQAFQKLRDLTGKRDVAVVVDFLPAATEHVRIPIGVGICGAAAQSGRTEIVADVSQDPRYLACFTSTRSEIVVPIFAEGRVVGEIDIDGEALNTFTRADKEFLERVARLLAPLAPTA